MQNDKILKISVAQNRKSFKWFTNEIKWSEFIERVGKPIRTTETYEQFMKLKKSQQDELKDVGGFVAGELKDNRRKAENVLNRYLVTLDADNIEPRQTQKILNLVDGLGCSYVIYSTRKHAEFKPRLRIIVPADRVISPEEYEPIARKIASFIGIEIMDRSTFEPSRLMYWPSCSKDSEFVFKYADKPFASCDGLLGLYKNWRDTNEWPKVPNETEIIKTEISKQKDPLEKENIVGDCSFKSDEDFLSWIDAYSIEWKRVLRPNGSAFMFCSSTMEARLEGVLSKHFNILSHIVWTKPNEPGYDGWKGKMKKEALRQWYPQSERIIFFEPASEGNMNRSYFGNLLRFKRKECDLSAHELTEIIGAFGKVNHGGAVSNWETGRNIPSMEQYEKIAKALNERGIKDGLPTYEDAIRPFEVNANIEFTDVWNFPSVKQYPGKHPAEKPIDMLEHCIRCTTFENDIVLDCFAGSGSTLVAALRCNRHAIGIEIDPHWCQMIGQRLEILKTIDYNKHSGYSLMKGTSRKKAETEMPSLFEMDYATV